MVKLNKQQTGIVNSYTRFLFGGNMKEVLYVGIDPGAKGAIAVLDNKGTCVELFDMPTTDEKYLNKIIEWLDKKVDKDICVMMENVHALPFESTVAGFSFGKNCGKAELLALAMSTDNSVKKVTPQTWKNHFLLKRFSDETKLQYKKRSIQKAKILFSNLEDKLTTSKDGRAEALLIAKYCYDKYIY